MNVYDGSGALVKSIHAGEDPVSIAINDKDELFVGDRSSGLIHKISANGNATLFYSECSFPSSMVFGADNNLYIADSKLNQVTVLDSSGNVIRTIGNGIIAYPTGLAYDFKNDRIIVAEHGAVNDTTEVTIYIFDLEGNLITSFGSQPGTSWFSGVKNPGNGQFSRIQGLTVSRCGTIYVIDPFQSNVSVFNEDAVFKTKFGHLGNETGELNIPLDIAMDSADRIIISSLNNGALEVYSYTDIVPTANIKLEDTSICSGESIDIPIHFTGVADYKFTYSIDGVEQDTIITAENPYILSTQTQGTYAVTSLSDAITTGTCFSGNPTITINSEAPTANISTDNAIICDGEEAMVTVDLTGAAPWTFTYTKNGQDPTEVVTSDPEYTFTINESGSFAITSLQGGGCTASILPEKMDIVVQPKPTAKFTNEKYNKINRGESLDLLIEFTGTPPYTVTYSFNETESVQAITTFDNPYKLTVSEEGAYQLINIEDAYCKNQKWMDWVDLQYYDYELPTAFIATADAEICPGDLAWIDIELTGAAPWTFTYTVNDLNPVEITTENNIYRLNADKDGTYKISSLKDAYAAGTLLEGSCTVTLLSGPLAEFYYDMNQLEVQFINASEGALTHYWDFGDGTGSTLENPVHSFDKKGDYTIVYTASNACGTMQKVESISVDRDEETVKVVLVYPNPSFGEFTIKITPVEPITSDVTISISNTSGRLVYTEVFDPNYAVSFDGSIYRNINLVNFNKGIYFINIYAENFEAQEKLILKD